MVNITDSVLLFNLFLTAVTFVAIGALLYCFYLALTIRRSLAVSAYKRQALWVAIMMIVLSAYGALYFSSYVVTTFDFFVFVILIAPATAIAIFEWIDKTVLLARRSDPLLRYALHWRVLRIVGWSFVAGPIILVLFYGLYLVVITGGTIIGQLFQPLNNLPSDFSQYTPAELLLTSFYLGFYFFPLSFATLFGAPALLLSGLRAGDAYLRRHVLWFGLAMVLLFVNIFAVGSTGLSPAFHVYFLLPMAYLLYRSAKSLAPINRLESSGNRLISKTALSMKHVIGGR